jgi:hypothetical protein
MRLEQMRAIAVELGQEPGTLPPLAGAGSWILTLPPRSQIAAGVVKAGGIVTTTPINLLERDAPTKLVSWRLLTIRDAVAIFASPEVDPATLEATITLTLRRGGDVVWSQSITALMQKEAAKAWSFSTTMGADLQNPIEVPTGKTLTLEGSVSTSTETGALGLSVNLGFLRPAGTFVESAGAIAYETVTGTGHRTL